VVSVPGFTDERKLKRYNRDGVTFYHGPWGTFRD
jgi:hypothetical protein